MIRFAPYYESRPWGGRRFEEDFGRHLPAGPVGEAWELVELEDRHSQVVMGPHEGKKLGDLWRSGLLGGSAKGPFPFLVKWLDTEEKLSVQVHPDEAAVAKMGKGQPKTEAWYVAQTEGESVLLVGHYPGLDAATLRQAATGGTIHKWLYELRPRVGEMLLVPAGTLHAVGAGFLLLEVQQPSDTTYRVHDWGRLTPEGTPREMHLDEACQAVSFERPGAPRSQRSGVAGPCFAMRVVRMGLELQPGPLRVLVADSGQAKIAGAQGEESLEYGDVIVAEREDGLIRITSGTCVLISEPA